MRKITSKHETDKKTKRKQLIIGIVLVFIMLFSMLGYSFRGRETNRDNGTESMTYNGFLFIQQNGYWLTEVNNQEFTFKYNPNQVQILINNLNSIDSYSGKALYISSENIDAEAEVYQNLDSIILRRQYACYENSEKDCEKDFPVKSCEDNLIIIEEIEAGEAEVFQQDNCLFIRGEAEELAKLTDSALFKIIGIS